MKSKLPDGWTHDMNISVGAGLSQIEVADYVLDSLLGGIDLEDIHAGLIQTFSLTCADAELALDRSQGGIIRALTGSMSNAPDERDDPIARRAFDIVWATLAPKGFFSRDRIATGEWEQWYHKRR